MLMLPSGVVMPAAFVGSTGISPGPAALAIWMGPAGAWIVPPLMATGPPMRLSCCPVGTESVLPFTLSAAGLVARNPNAAGAAAVSVLPDGVEALNLAPSAKRR